MITLLSLSLAFADPSAADLNQEPDIDLGAGFDAPTDTPDGIINGAAATVDNWPQAGALLLETDAMGFNMVTMACSSTLIAPDVVLLAAHCIDPAVYQQQGIDIDTTNLYWSREPNIGLFLQEPPADAVGVAHRVAHEDFNIFTMSVGIAQNADIALLFLDTALTENPLAVLPTPTEALQIEQGAAVSVVGWGQTTTAQTSAGNKMHGVSHIAELGTHELKIGEVVGDVRKCHGDSGGPTFLEIETEALDTWRQIGITSHAYDQTDCDSTGGVDTRVDPYLTWIDDQMTAACNDGRRVWCETPGIIQPEFPATEDEDDAAKACGCSASPMSSLAFGWLAIPLVLRRRRS
ncbi:MAG: trypsin-like serine protease [Deltaproteobacteria bacterium]|nr:MAG: trypsin-like serine protease [Deltaproteobacteria bacterium]